MRQGYIDKLGPQTAIAFDGLVHGRLHIRVESGDEILFGQTDAQPLDGAGQGGGILRHRGIDTGGVFGVVAGQGTQHDGTVSHIAGQRADLIE